MSAGWAMFVKLILQHAIKAVQSGLKRIACWAIISIYTSRFTKIKMILNLNSRSNFETISVKQQILI